MTETTLGRRFYKKKIDHEKIIKSIKCEDIGNSAEFSSCEKKVNKENGRTFFFSCFYGDF